ncbi:hypothetical protein Godav_021849 [Gossypium davidsonii]|uniref:RNase H type-1 domain-containing protein n=1 Tax=Gossypium davidsonii TaxID=34287 RepID=A0A7J8TG45_GOSDV|nr:hypothetical protein [Gossypium davidsonii]
MKILDKKAFEYFISTLWNIWNSRNNAICRGKEEDANVILEHAHKLNNNLRIHNVSPQPILPWVPRCCKWEKSLEGVIKLNADATVDSYGMSLGIIVRDSDGFFLSGKASFINKVLTLSWRSSMLSLMAFNLLPSQL